MLAHSTDKQAETPPLESQPLRAGSALADRVQEAVLSGLGQAAAAELERLAGELANLLSPEWDLADVVVSEDDYGPCFLVILTDSGQWMRYEDLPATFHGIRVWPLFASKTASPAEL